MMLHVESLDCAAILNRGPARWLHWVLQDGLLVGEYVELVDVLSINEYTSASERLFEVWHLFSLHRRPWLILYANLCANAKAVVMLNAKCV